MIEPDPGRRRRLLSFVLVGAGCTGVELATELLDLARKTLVRHYRGLDPREVRIVLAEATGQIWTAGVRATPVVEALPVERDKLGRAVVDETLELPPFPGVYVIGDSTHSFDPRLQAVLPPTAQVAVQQARSVAGNIARLEW
ncbi:MAG: FAD-dependent oxidoreductase [candidate division NC10 bacterium]|nr:FAD-dependent oxidoreductase [candidate division NC10 bacterium]